MKIWEIGKCFGLFIDNEDGVLRALPKTRKAYQQKEVEEKGN